jgi:hypothetical protein
MTTGVNRRELLIMGQRAHDTTLSLDDGIPYYPTVSVIAESPHQRGVLYVGTDDGNLQVSIDDGATWTNVTDRVPGIPPSSWMSGIEPSRHVAGTVYLAVNNYRNNDFSNYLYKSTDQGRSWSSIVVDLPPDRVVRTVREDPRNANVLYVGTEIGLFFTNDRGAHWYELKNNLPTAAFNDLLVHPRDNDLILGTHGRGIWILDNIAALQQLTPDVLSSAAHLFTIEPAEMVRLSRAGGHTGDMHFSGQNPPFGAIIDYYLREKVDSDSISITIHDAAGNLINTLQPRTTAGVNRVTWNLRHANIGPPMRASGMNRGPAGPWVLPGDYTAHLTVAGSRVERSFTVSEDPRIDVAADSRAEWHAAVSQLAAELEAFLPIVESIGKIQEQLDSLPADTRQAHAELAEEIGEVYPKLTELRSRMSRLYGQVSGAPAPLTADQRSQHSYFQEWVRRLEPAVARILAAELP